MNKVVIIFAIAVIAGTVLNLLFMGPKSRLGDAYAQDAAKYQLTERQTDFFAACRMTFDKRTSRYSIEPEFASRLPETGNEICRCIAESVGTPGGKRMHQMTKLLIQGAMWGRDKPRDDALLHLMKSEAVKSMVTGVSRADIIKGLEAVRHAQKICTRRVRQINRSRYGH